MSEIENRIAEITDRLTSIQKRQYALDSEIHSLRNELDNLKNILRNQTGITATETTASAQVKHGEVIKPQRELTQRPPFRRVEKPYKAAISSHALEDFIGTNLISKVGILITIIGVFIGAKYAMDKDLISPAMRIVFGYVAGAGLMITAFKLKSKYENFSAVLIGGGLAILYFITYIAYGFYQLFPQGVSFLLMVAITASAVFIALWYNQKIIAVIGQVGAYAVPFLLSDGSGNVLILFTYISIINAGLLILSFRKNWKVLYRIAFFLTWIIYASWLFLKERTQLQADEGLIFLCINFLTFYVTFLSYKVMKKELYNLPEIALMLVNALLFFFLGGYLVDEVFTNPHSLTYFTIANAAVHFATGISIHRLKLSDDSVYQFILGLGLLFVTIAIPVELNGSWVTLLWAVEAAILCWIALKNNRSSYLAITAPMVIIAIISLIQDWYQAYPHLNFNAFEAAGSIHPFRNINFFFSLVTSTCFGYISFACIKITWGDQSSLITFFKKGMPVLFVVILYLTFYNEIHFAWDILVNRDEISADDHAYLRDLSLMIYSFLFVALFLEVTRRYIKSRPGILLLLAASIVCAAVFLFSGLIFIGNLRENYLANKNLQDPPSAWLLRIRYVCFFSLAILVISAHKAVKTFADRKNIQQVFSSAFNILLLSIICNEFIHWMDVAGYQNQYKLGLSIICALYALILVIIGIATKRKHLRIGAIVLFGVTLIKLFFYDLATLSTISKTLVLVILGVILLVISFLYNKYKSTILGDESVLATEENPS